MRTFAESNPVGHAPEGAPTYQMPLGVRAHRIDQSVIDGIKATGMSEIAKQKTTSLLIRAVRSPKTRSMEKTLADKISRLEHYRKIHNNVHKEVGSASEGYSKKHGHLPTVNKDEKTKLNIGLDYWQTGELYSANYCLEENWRGLDADLKVGGTDEEHNNPYTV